MENWKEGGKVVDTQQVAFGKVGDFIKGVYTGKKLVQTSNGEAPIFELRAIVGQYHLIDEKKNPIEPPVEAQPGAFYTVWGSLKSTSGAYAITSLFDKVELGEIVSIELEKETPSKTKGNAPWKKYDTRQYGREVAAVAPVTTEDVQQALGAPEEEPVE